MSYWRDPIGPERDGYLGGDVGPFDDPRVTARNHRMNPRFWWVRVFVGAQVRVIVVKNLRTSDFISCRKIM